MINRNGRCDTFEGFLTGLAYQDIRPNTDENPLKMPIELSFTNAVLFLGTYVTTHARYLKFVAVLQQMNLISKPLFTTGRHKTMGVIENTYTPVQLFTSWKFCQYGTYSSQCLVPGYPTWAWVVFFLFHGGRCTTYIQLTGLTLMKHVYRYTLWHSLGLFIIFFYENGAKFFVL